MANIRRPLSLYAEHANISIEAARKRLKRLGIDYLQPFDFEDADRRFHDSRHGQHIVHSEVEDDDEIDPETKKNPKFIEHQARREMFKANLTELEYLQQIGTLIPAADIDEEWFTLSRLVRDAMLNIPARIADQLAHETDQRKVHDLLEAEIYKALESLGAKESQAA